MINRELNLPLYAKASLLCIGAVAFTAILYLAQNIIVPLIFATIIAILLSPVVTFLVKHRVNRIVAIIATLLLAFTIIIVFGALLISQAVRFSESWPLLVDRFTEVMNQSISWFSGYFDINSGNIHEWGTKTKGELMNISSAEIGKTIMMAGNLAIIVFIIPVYIFLILYYRPLFSEFISRLFDKKNHAEVKDIVTQIKNLVQKYLTGLIMETSLVAILQITTLFILGIEYAVLLGIIGALLNLIPYIGGIVAVALPMMVALATKANGWYAIYVLIIYYIIQLVDNNYIVPRIVASKVKINALVSIIVVIVGNAMWGIPGMFLSIPLIAIVKLIFDHIEPMKPWGFLLGDTMPSIIKIKPIFKILKKKTNDKS